MFGITNFVWGWLPTATLPSQINDTLSFWLPFWFKGQLIFPFGTLLTYIALVIGIETYIIGAKIIGVIMPKSIMGFHR